MLPLHEGICWEEAYNFEAEHELLYTLYCFCHILFKCMIISDCL